MYPGGTATARQIHDLAEKRVVRAARDTSGPGSPRLYDRKNVFEIFICLALRGKLPPHGKTVELLREVLGILEEDIKLQGISSEHESIEYLVIDVEDPNGYTIKAYTEERLKDLQNGWVSLRGSRTTVEEKRPGYCQLLLNIKAVVEDLKGVI